MSIYEGRNNIYLLALAHREELFEILFDVLQNHHKALNLDPTPALQTLALDAALCPRTGGEQTLHCHFDFDAAATFNALSAMELPRETDKPKEDIQLTIKHPGGIGEILFVADGGSWLKGVIESNASETSLHYSPQ
jgi:hypothetical protein